MIHHHIPETYTLNEMLDILNELDLMINYTFIPIAIEHWDNSGLLHIEDPMDYRIDVLKPLMELGKLTPEQIMDIAIVDNYVLSHDVPIEMIEFQDWLKTNAIPIPTGLGLSS